MLTVDALWDSGESTPAIPVRAGTDRTGVAGISPATDGPPVIARIPGVPPRPVIRTFPTPS